MSNSSNQNISEIFKILDECNNLFQPIVDTTIYKKTTTSNALKAKRQIRYKCKNRSFFKF
jgi:hypothetical protein